MMVYCASAGSCIKSASRNSVCRLHTHSLGDDTFLDIYLEHPILASCYKDLSCALGCKVHTLEVLKLVASIDHISALIQFVLYLRPLPNIHKMPLCYSAPMSVVNALLRNRQDTLLGEEKLLDWAFCSSMAAV